MFTTLSPESIQLKLFGKNAYSSYFFFFHPEEQVSSYSYAPALLQMENLFHEVKLVPGLSSLGIFEVAKQMLG